MIEILRLSVPITVWLTGFSALYALQGLSCSRHWPAGLDPRPVLLAGWAVAVMLQILCLLVILRGPSLSRFVQTTALTLAAAALVASVWTMAPALAVSPCQ
ncbi:MAG: hypothetical protein H7317_17805 [Pseudorhodobacter sp.]|nr:hypothetical protein [Pseudorhodobacter sp.]